MVTPVSHFRRLDPDEVGGIAGGIVGGLDKGLSTMSALNQLYQQKLANQLQQGRADIQPQMLQSQLLQSQARTPNIEAQTGYMQAKTGNIPIENILKSQSLYGKSQEGDRLSARFGPGFKINRLLNTVQGQSLYSSNKDFARSVDEVLSGQVTHTNRALINNLTGIDVAAPGQGQQQHRMLPAFEKQFNVPGYQQQLQAQQPQQLQQQQQEAYQQPVVQGQSNNGLLDALRRQSGAGGQQLQQQQGGQTQAPIQPAGTASGNEQFGVTDEDVAAGQAITRDALITKTTPTLIQNQRVYADSVDRMFDQWDPHMKDIVKFAGAAGKANLTADKYASAFGLETSPEYEEYVKFITAAIVIANEYRRNLGGHGTEAEQNTMKVLVNPNSWTKTPKLALASWNELRTINKANIKALSMSQGEIQEDLKKRLQRGENPQAQVSQGIQSPTFQNKQEYHIWFNKLSKEDKRAYRNQIGKR